MQEKVHILNQSYMDACSLYDFEFWGRWWALTSPYDITLLIEPEGIEVWITPK